MIILVNLMVVLIDLFVPVKMMKNLVTLKVPKMMDVDVCTLMV